MSLWVLVEVARRNAAAREAEGTIPYRNPERPGTPLPAGDGPYDTATGTTPGMAKALDRC